MNAQPDQQITAYYPSGYTVRMFGRFKWHGKVDDSAKSPYAVAVEVLESTNIADQILPAGCVAMLDPRCVVVGDKSGMIYTPQPHRRKFPKDMRRWMKQNPDWPARLKLP